MQKHSELCCTVIPQSGIYDTTAATLVKERKIKVEDNSNATVIASHKQAWSC